MFAGFHRSQPGRQTMVLGDQLSGADIQMSYPLEASVARGLIDDHYPAIQSYVERIHQQLAYQAALLKGGKYDYA